MNQFILPLMVAVLLTVTPDALYASSQGAAPQAPASRTPPNFASLDKAMTVARLVQPSDLAVAAALPMVEKAFRQAFVEGASKNSTPPNTESRGMVDGFWSVMKPLLTTYLNEQIPGLHDKLASLYASRLTESELDHLARFYGTTTGRKIVRQMHFGFDADPMIGEVIANVKKDKGSDISVDAVNAGVKGALRGLPALMTPADSVALQALARAVPIAKLKNVGIEVQTLMMEWSNAADPNFDRKLDAAMAAYMQDIAGNRTAQDAQNRPRK